MQHKEEKVVEKLSNGKICFADFELDTAHRRLRRAGEPVALNAKAFDVLEFLAGNAGRIVTKNEILDAVWENQFVEEANLKVQISALRKALGEQKNEHRYLVTLPGKGYKFVADVRNGANEIVIEKHSVSHLVVEDEKEIVTAHDVSAHAGGRRQVMRALYAGAILVLTAAAAAGFWYVKTGDQGETAVAAPAEPDLKRLTSHGRVNRVELSPDAKFFAYTIRKRGSYETEMRLGQTDGGSDVLLRTVPDFSQYTISFSSDGHWLYYVEIPAFSEYEHSRGAFYKMPVLRGVPQKLSDSASVFSVLSPDDKRIAFPRYNSEKKASTIVVSDLDGANEHEVVARPGDQSIDHESLTWSADGLRIAFAAATGTSKIDSANRSYEVFAVHLPDGRVDQLTAADWNRLGSLEWIKDGTGLVAVGRNSEQINTSSLWLIGFPGGKVQRLSRDVNRYAWTSSSADSSVMVAVQQEAETNLWIASSDDLAASTQITFSSSGRQDGWHGVDWTPDGRILYTAWIDESLTLWIMDPDGTNATQLTSVGFRDERPVVSADGKFVVFESNRSGAREIWSMEIDGSNLRQLTTGGGNSSPSISADGVWVVHRDARDTLWRRPFAGGEPVLIADKEVVIPRVSPDGKLVACAATFDGKMKLAIYPIEGGEPFKVFDLPTTRNFRYSLKWSPDSTSVYYPDSVNGIWRHDIAGGPPTRIEGIPAERTFAYAWSRDGRQFVFGRQREERDVVLISNFR